MPLFEFKCYNCGAKDEMLLHSKSEMPNIMICKTCGNEMSRVFSPTPAIFNCDGFYTTDYARKDKESL